MITACTDMNGKCGDLKIVGSFLNNFFEFVSSSITFFTLDNFLRLPDFFLFSPRLDTTVYSSHCQNVEG